MSCGVEPDDEQVLPGANVVNVAPVDEPSVHVIQGLQVVGYPVSEIVKERPGAVRDEISLFLSGSAPEYPMR